MRKLRFNGQEVPVIANQMIFDLSDIDLGVLVEDEPPRKRSKPKCECGSWAIGVKDYMTGHNSDCPVHEDKTPVM